MKVILDESLPKRLKKDFKDYQVTTVPEAGWQGKKNGELLRLIEGSFDVFVTADQNLQYQLNLRNTTTPIVVLVASDNRYESLRALIPKILSYLKTSRLERIKVIS